jgi:hypothetical protein
MNRFRLNSDNPRARARGIERCFLGRLRGTLVGAYRRVQTQCSTRRFGDNACLGIGGLSRQQPMRAQIFDPSRESSVLRLHVG